MNNNDKCNRLMEYCYTVDDNYQRKQRLSKTNEKN